MRGAFISFPAATMTLDPAGVITRSSTSGLLVTAQSPVLAGALSPVAVPSFPFYDAAAHRWLPVSSGATSPDGSHYAYSGSSSAPNEVLIHVVDVATGADKTYSFSVPIPSLGSTEVADFDGAGVEFTPSGPGGVWRLDLANGSVGVLNGVPGVEAVQGRTEWAGLNDPRDPNPPGAGVTEAPFDTLVSVNFATGARTVWDYEPGRTVQLDAVDGSGRPIVTVYDPADGNARIQRLVAPGRADFVYSAAMSGLSYVRADGERLWFGGASGVYVYTPAAGLRKVYALASKNGVATEGLVPAGFCV